MKLVDLAGDEDATADVVAAMGRSELFASLTDAERRRIVEVVAVLEVPVGHVLTHPGEISDTIYVLLSGEVSIGVAVHDDSLVEVATLGAGDVIGELGALLEEPRTAQAVTTRSSTVLRLRGHQLVTLAGDSPGLTMNAMRMLARRLRTQMVSHDEQVMREDGDIITVAVPELRRQRAYMARYYATAVQNVLKRHRLIVERRYPRYRAEFTLTDADLADWHQVFDTHDGPARHTPFSYYQNVGTMLLMRVVEDVGVNFRYLLHMRHELARRPSHPLVAGERYAVEVSLADIVPLGDDRVALIVEWRLSAEDGSLRLAIRDFFAILQLEPEYVDALQALPLQPSIHADKLRPPRLPTLNGDARATTIEVPDDMGARYGRISGDMNMVHTTRVAAKVFGYEAPFIQGYCTLNYMLRTLTTAGIGAVEEIAVSFVRKIYTGTTIGVVHTDDRIEVTDARGKLAAVGSWRSAEPAADTAG